MDQNLNSLEIQSYNAPISADDDNDFASLEKTPPLQNNSPSSQLSTSKKRSQLTFEEKQSKFPVLRNFKSSQDPFLGTKRAFLAAHKHKAQISFQIQDKAWEVQERSRKWNYKHEMDLLQTNIKIRDDDYLRRINKPHPKRGERRVPTTTGPRHLQKLPPDRQVTEYPRFNLHYFG